MRFITKTVTNNSNNNNMNNTLDVSQEFCRLKKSKKRDGGGIKETERELLEQKIARGNKKKKS